MSEHLENLRRVGDLEQEHERATVVARDRLADVVALVKTVGAKRFTAELASRQLPSLDDVSYVDVAEEIAVLEESLPESTEVAIEAATEVLRQQLAVERARQQVVEQLVNGDDSTN